MDFQPRIGMIEERAQQRSDRALVRRDRGDGLDKATQTSARPRELRNLLPLPLHDRAAVLAHTVRQRATAPRAPLLRLTHGTLHPHSAVTSVSTPRARWAGT